MHHGERAVLLVDEYDAAILTAWEHGYYEDAVAFFRALLSAGLKHNPFVFKGVLTGILRVARESLFSGLNNVQVYSILGRGRAEHFGFTEAEVSALLDAFSRRGEEHEVRHWYSGYRFCETTVHNPWSILSMLAYPANPLEPYWLNTSENALVRTLLLDNPSLHGDIATLVAGGSIERDIDESVALRDLRGHHVWSLLLFAGYLRADSVRMDDGLRYVTLSIPNREVRTVWTGTFREWLRMSAGGLDPLHQAILTGNAAQVEALLSRMLLLHVSAHDVAMDQDEAFYHAFVLGLLVTLEKTHAVRSNREVGLGRADVTIVPKSPGLPGVVLEFKRRQGRKKLSVHRRDRGGRRQRHPRARDRVFGEGRGGSGRVIRPFAPPHGTRPSRRAWAGLPARAAGGAPMSLFSLACTAPPDDTGAPHPLDSAEEVFVPYIETLAESVGSDDVTWHPDGLLLVSDLIGTGSWPTNPIGTEILAVDPATGATPPTASPRARTAPACTSNN